ncbi:MAG TPA: cysteine--1-D-myo-inosityl 2-amino-2-deoxy-alpha-D-glucopyranoside ligase [Nocardioidaceae bacterium]|nr:cysteine--1-D-myo-inosityl 2-amino-2-deoxy-alpha-D-glucopyranoside ligase [Nocardioidaceae bacterium]
MRAWPNPDVPALDALGPAPAVQVHDTATGALRTTAPDGPARMYVCGITPYDATHLGHAATYVAFDLLNRAWRDAGHEVRYVQNVTDVDDPLLERAAATGVDWQDLAEKETELFRTDMAALRVIAPDEYIGAVESIPLVVEVVQQLQDRGFVYEVDGDLYFSVHSDPRFGSVSGLDTEQMLAVFPERGGDPDRPGKKHPLDCLLWQAERPGEPAWDTVLGRGRPGWHVECSSIALRFLGENFDVQGGGSDLAFPHHEMSASEAQAAFEGLTFAQAYVHAGMVGYQGEKMSKSKGNLVLVSRLREDGVDPMAIRLALLGHHYRSDWEWTDEDLHRAQARLAAWREAVGRTSREAAERLVAEVRRALATDLDAPAALEAVDAWAAAAGAGDAAPEASGTELVRTLLDARLGVLL